MISDRTPLSGPGVLLVLLTMAMVMMPRVCGAGNDGRVPWRGLITLECRITTAREETSNLPQHVWCEVELMESGIG